MSPPPDWPGGGDFVLAVTDNQPKLRDAIEAEFPEQLERNREGLKYRAHETTDRGHGRLDERSYFVTKIPPEFAAKKDWPWVPAIGSALRVTPHAEVRETSEVRFDIVSRYLSGKRFRVAVRPHGAIESMHGVLDVTFREDDSRTRERTRANNLSGPRGFADPLPERHPIKDRIRGQMLRGPVNTDFLTEVLTFQEDSYALAVGLPPLPTRQKLPPQPVSNRSGARRAVL